MRKEKKHILLKIILVALLGFGVYVVFWNIPVSVTTIEKTIQNVTVDN